MTAKELAKKLMEHPDAIVAVQDETWNEVVDAEYVEYEYCETAKLIDGDKYSRVAQMIRLR